MGGLRLAGMRALATVAAAGHVPDLVILDGNHDWLTPPGEVGLFAFVDGGGPSVPPVTTMIKADMTCSSVAAASVLAKVERDGLMVGHHADHPAVRLGGQQGLRRAGAHGGAAASRAEHPPPAVVAAAGAAGGRT